MYIEKSILRIKQVLLLACMSVFLVSCGQTTVINDTITNTTNTEFQETEKILVASSIIPLSSVINTIGWDYVEVNNIVPAWVSPHGFDLSAKQMVQVEESDIVFLTWLEHIDGFFEKAVWEKKQIHLADGMELLESSGHEHHEEDGHDEENNEDAHDTDPHVWLGKENIIMISEKVRDELSLIMPEQTEYFSANTASFTTELEKIYTDFASQTSGKTPEEFIVFHDAYNYLMESIWMDLNLKVPFSENVLHESGTAHMAELVEEVETHGVKYLFKEPQFNDGNLQKFVNQYSLELGILDPLGTDASANGYFNNIKSNLETLSKVYE